MKIQIEEADLRSVLEKLETAYCNDTDWHDGYYKEAITICEQALAEQPAQQQNVETITQTFTGLPKRKLNELLAAGWQVNGVCFQRTEEDGTVRRGAVTIGGMVLWWNQPAQQQEPVAFLANGTRFKISYDSRQSGGQIHGIPPELGGRWVAFVAADDDCHLKLASPPIEATPLASQRSVKPWVGLTDWEREKLRSEADEADAGYGQLIKATEAKLREKNA